MYDKKKYFVIVGIFALSLLLIILVMQKIYRNTINEKDILINQLQTELDRIGEMETVYRLVTNVKAGNKCNDYELEIVNVPTDLYTENIISDSELILGQYYKLDLAAGTILTKEMFTQYDLTDDLRYMDVVFDEIPIGLEAGDFIDVRISFPLGQDYIALPYKQVAEINGSTVKLIVGQKDFYVYESMKTDIATFKSTKIYGAQYVEGGIQKAAKAYYPVNLEVLLTMVKDPNINTGDYGDTLALREQLEEQLFNSERIDIASTVTSGRQSINQKFTKAKEDYEKLQMKKEQALERAKKDTIQENN